METVDETICPVQHVIKPEMLRKVVRPGRATIDNTISAIAVWGKGYRMYTEGTNETLADSMRTIFLLEMAPTKIEEHLELNARTIDTYALARGEIAKYVDNTSVGAQVRCQWILVF